jgi:site-specific recombinase XerD
VDRELQSYLRYHRTQGSSNMTLDWHRNTIRYFVRYLVAEGLPATVADGLTPGNVRAWLDAQREGGLAQRTLATRVQSLKAFSKWLCEEDYLPKDPLAKLKPPKFDDVAKETLTPDEVDRLLQACVHHNRQHVTGLRDRAIILLLYSTGLRSAELVNLQESDLDWDRGLLLVRRGKGGKFRQVPLAGKAARALDRYLRHKERPHGQHVFLTTMGEPLTQNGLVQMLKRYEGWRGIHCNPHKFRHTAAITYLRNGGRVETLRAMLGHSKIDQTLHYARIAGVDLAAAHELADPARSLKTRV